LSVAPNGPPDALEVPVAGLWRLRPPGPEDLFASPEFLRLTEAVQTHYPNWGKTVFALGTALRSLGLPCELPAERQQSPINGGRY
jgi:hypothetical protein